MARNDQIDEFWWPPNFRIPGVISRWIRVRSQKLCPIANENDQEWPNRRVLWPPNFRVPGVMSHWNRVRSQKLSAIAHENGQKWPNRRVLTTSQFSCTRGLEPLKSCLEPKTMCYSPRRWPEMTKSTSFDDLPIYVYQGSLAVEIVSGAKN